jgi:hypothetical protein
MAFVIHTHSGGHLGHQDMRHIVNFTASTWLFNTQLVIVDGIDPRDSVDQKRDRRRLNNDEVFNNTTRELLHVIYNGNPGCFVCPNPSYVRVSGYYGAHRTIAGVLMAYDTFHADWIVVIDDDNYIDLSSTSNRLLQLNAAVPLLLAGRIGPHHLGGSCYNESLPGKWFCCTNPHVSCHAYLDKVEPGKQAIFALSRDKTTMEIQRYCTDDDYRLNECCRTAPWPEGIGSGYPYRVVRHNATYTPHYASMHPYGGAGYVVSKGIIEAMGRASWEKCMYGIQCHNADKRIMTCILNAGYTLTAFSLPVDHHLKSLNQFLGVGKKMTGPDKDLFFIKKNEYLNRLNQTVASLE